MKITKVGLTALELLAAYPTSLVGDFRNRRLFKDVETYCMFIGYPRSGHSLIGSLLDAHSKMIIAHELGSLKYLHAGFSQRQLYYLLLENSRTFTTAGRSSPGYSYRVPNQWQGRFQTLRVIGDKKAQGATLRLQTRPWLRQRLSSRLDSRIKFIHIVRNPYDNISTMFKKSKEQNVRLEDCASQYFSLCQTVLDLKEQIGETDLFELRHESFIDSPQSHLRELCNFLGVDASPDYLIDCAGIVFKSPRRRRYEQQWSQDLIEIVRQKIDHFPFLQGYSYDD